MPCYSDEVLNEVFSSNDIVDYISQYVNLKRSGRDYSGLCPFHSEKSPSFHVSRDKQLFHCFGCGASGNLVQFVMRKENLDFLDALQLLADRAGIILPEKSSYVDNKAHEKKQLIYQMNKVAARFFYDILSKNSIGEPARRYFAERQISTRTIITYGLGYAPDSYDALLNFLREKGYKTEDIVEAGLCVQRDNKIYDKFRNRVMFPIIDLRGNVIGFGGRIISDAPNANGFKAPKYLNSSETPVFHKGNNLFSMNLAKREQTDELILAEGYMDVISVYQAGVRNIVATLGTALTENQAKLLLRYCSEILLCYDSDEAGQKAILRAIDIINAVGGKSKVIRMAGAKDPDEYIKKNGAEMFRSIVKNAMPSTEFKLMLIKNKNDVTTTEGKIKFVNSAAQALTGIKDAVEVEAYIRRIADETQLNPDAVYSAYKKSSQANTPRHTSNVKADINRNNSSKHTSRLISAEKKLLNLITMYKKLFKLAETEITPEEFSLDIHKRLAQQIYEIWQEGHEPEPAKLLINFGGDDVKTVSEIFYNMETYSDNEKAVHELIKTIKRENIQIRINGEKNPIKLKELLKELNSLNENM